MSHKPPIWLHNARVSLYAPLLLQHHQRVCVATEGGAQGVPAAGVVAATQGEISQRVPPTAGLLCRTVPRERPQPH